MTCAESIKSFRHNIDRLVHSGGDKNCFTVCDKVCDKVYYCLGFSCPRRSLNSYEFCVVYVFDYLLLGVRKRQRGYRIKFFYCINVFYRNRFFLALCKFFVNYT